VIVTSEGFNVHPEDIEAVVKSVAGVRDAIAVGIDRSGSTELHAVLLLRNGVQPEQVIQEANGQLETHQVIRNWSVYPDADFPRTSLMKVRREQVAARLRRSGETAAGRVPPLQEILAIGDRRLRLQLLADHLVQTADGLGSSPVTRLSDFGFGSLDLVELLTLVESRLGVPLDHASLPAGLTVPELVSLARSWGDAAPERRSSAAPAAFSINPIGSALRRVVQPGIIGLWSWFAGATPAVEKLAAMPTGTPVIIAAAPHRHWLDAFVLYRALPRRLRTKIAVVTNFDFDERFGAAAAPAGKRLLAGAAYYVALPLTFAFVILPQRTATRDGLFQLGRLLDLGYNPITFPKGLFTGDRDTDRHDPGVAMIALETQTPILPVWIEHNDSLRVFPQGRRRRPTVRFGDLIPITPTLARDQLVRQVETAFRKLAP
jgi:long-chain acyl-CoA synthetase